MTNQTDYRLLDLGRFAMALVVVFIHVMVLHGLRLLPYGMNYVIALAVPYFFMASGFLLQLKLSSTTESMRRAVVLKYSKRIARMFVLWAVIYIPLTIYGYYTDKDAYTGVLDFVRIQIQTLVFNGDMINAWSIWYLFSLAIGTQVIGFTYGRKWSQSIIFILGLITLLVVYLYEGGYCEGKIWWLFHKVTHRIFGAFAYVVLGMWVQRVSRLRSLPLAICAVALSVLIFCFDFPFYQLFGAGGLMVLSVILTIPVSTDICVYLRKQSMWIYLVHLYVLVLLYHAFRSVFSSTPLLFFVGCAGSFMVSALLIKWSGKPSGSFLKKLV